MVVPPARAQVYGTCARMLVHYTEHISVTLCYTTPFDTIIFDIVSNVVKVTHCLVSFIFMVIFWSATYFCIFNFYRLLPPAIPDRGGVTTALTVFKNDYIHF